MWEGYVCSQIKCLLPETNFSDDAFSRKILANIFTKFDWSYWACFLQSIFGISVFLRFSMILKSVIQEIVSKLIPDLVVILVAISLNAFVFMKFPFKILFPFTKNFSSQNFEILKTFYIRSGSFDWNVVSSLKVISRLKRTDSSCPSENICNLIPPRVTSSTAFFFLLHEILFFYLHWWWT